MPRPSKSAPSGAGMVLRLEMTSSILRIITAVSEALRIACSTTLLGSKTLSFFMSVTPPS